MIPETPRHFSQISEEAQGLIVSAVMGEFDATGPPSIPGAALDEIYAWLASGDDVEETLTGKVFGHGE